MINSRLVQTIKAFSLEEIKDLKAFLSNSYFLGGSHSNKNLQLFTLIIQKNQANKLEDLRKEKVNAVLFNKTEDDRNFKYLANRMSELMNAIRKYIMIKEVEKTFGKAFEEIALARFYSERNLPLEENKSLKRARATIQSDTSSQRDQYLLQYWLEAEVTNFESFHNNRTGELNLMLSLKTLSEFYGIKLLELSMLITQQKRVSPTFNFHWETLMSSMRAVFKTHNALDNPSILLMERAIVLMENLEVHPFEEVLQQYLQLLKENESTLSFRTHQNLATYGRNYCNWYINKGNINLRNTRFNMYKDHFEKGLLYENGKMIPSTFINLIYVGLVSKKNNWVLNMLSQVQQEKYLSGQHPQNLVHFGYAWYYFQNNRLDKARARFSILLKSKKFEDTGLEIRSKVLGIKLSYEEEANFNQIQSLLLSFDAYIRRRRKNINSTSYQMNLNFIKCIKKIIKHKEKLKYGQLNNSRNLKVTQTLINQWKSSSFPVTSQTWLIQKLTNLQFYK